MASATLTYAYADSQAVLGPLALVAEPGCYDLCREHAAALTVPNGWDVIRLEPQHEPRPSADDLEALADAVREAADAWDEPQRRPVERPAGVVEIARRGHLTVLADGDARPRG